MDEENKTPESVPYFVYESEITRADMRFKRMVVALVVSIILIFASNIAWLVHHKLNK